MASDTSRHTPKRRKTSVACDYCRMKKLRCDWLHVSPPVCKHCSEYGIHCCTSVRRPPASDTPALRQLLPTRTPSSSINLTRSSQRASPCSFAPPSQNSRKLEAPTHSSSRYLGSTSLSHLFKDVSSGSPCATDPHDAKFGLYRANSDFLFTAFKNDIAAEARLSAEQLSVDVIASLISWYRIHVAPLYPVVSPEELQNIDGLPLATVFAVCAISSLARHVPQNIFLSARRQLSSALDSVIGSSSISHCQAILVSCMSAEVHASSTSFGGSLSWLRSGLAIRMAQDLGVHRQASPLQLDSSSADFRKRVWMACVITDRWYSCSFGQPLMIDIEAFDNSFDESNSGSSFSPVHVEIYKVSLLMGRVLRAMYSPAGLMKTNDAELDSILIDLDRMKGDLPVIFLERSEGPSVATCLINLITTSVEVLLLRPFVQGRNQDSRITFRPSISRWNAVVFRARQAIHWVATDGEILLDVWFIGMYCFTYLALVQFHAHVKEGDMNALNSLKEADECMARWADANGDKNEPSSLRNRVSDILHRLYMAALLQKMPINEEQQGCTASDPNETGNASRYESDGDSLANRRQDRPSETFTDVDINAADPMMSALPSLLNPNGLSDLQWEFGDWADALLLGPAFSTNVDQDEFDMQ